MTVSQDSFRDALLDADKPVPDGLRDGNDAPAGARFSVYRNNVVLSLTEAMATAFPLISKLLGGETFNRLAGFFVRAHPPSSPLMMFYGEALPEFLEHFQPLAHIGYLADCARLDLARRQAYHAADAPAFDPASLQSEGVNDMRLTLAPATQIIRSPWPLYDIWRFNTEEGAPKPRAVAQDVLITRPEFDPQVQLLPTGAALWLQSLAAGASFEHALETTMEQIPDFDLASALTLTLTAGAFAQDPKKDTA